MKRKPEKNDLIDNIPQGTGHGGGASNGLPNFHLPQRFPAMGRRSFLLSVGLLSSGLLTGLGVASWKEKLGLSTTGTKGAPYCRKPRTHEEETMEAVAATIIPGPEVDPDGIVGAVEVCALNVVYDPTFYIKPLIPLLVKDLDFWSLFGHGKQFKQLPGDKRLEVLRDRYEHAIFPLNQAYYLVVVTVKGAFYAAPFSTEGLDSLDYPGPTIGYDVRCSFGRPMSSEMTPDGNLP